MKLTKKRLAVAAASVLVAGGLAVAVAGTAQASTHACDIAPATAGSFGCVSLNAEVPGLPDLDVQGGSAVSGNVLIAFTRTNHDKAEDFVFTNLATTGSGLARQSTFAVTGTYSGALTTATPLSTIAAATKPVQIQFAPNGVLSGLCVSSVNPNGHASVQLRHCNTDPARFNPYQTFQQKDTGNPGDGQFITFTEVINGHLLTDPRNDGYIGHVGARIQIKTAGSSSNIHTGQLWGFNGN
jgi:hypothetical protein